MTIEEKIAEIIFYIKDVLKDDLDPERYANALLDRNYDSGMPDENDFEVRGLHTKTGAPFAFTIGK